ncbi:hypothetical protein [Natranaeroarchaeum sulfidigenes]|uniref:Uncharacterized protein n=1 Tax=Natranaeroarchaeum sulfidigenes TaxID=2784880 RepID=A0A897MQB8_9EURY|nr:hypothetical protein [Natranaeroarchaeum sulfidigenes]QSG02531.1 hypothetical protein AArcS_1314 [Natranaeroarchaeum sulfidigenes]
MMIRSLTIILVMSNAAANFLYSAGVAQVWGMGPETGIDREVSRGQDAAEAIGSGPLGLIDAIGGATLAAVDALTGFFSIIFAAPTLVLNMGVPEFIVIFAFAPLYIAAAFDLISVLRGMQIS